WAGSEPAQDALPVLAEEPTQVVVTGPAGFVGRHDQARHAEVRKAPRKVDVEGGTRLPARRPGGELDTGRIAAHVARGGAQLVDAAGEVVGADDVGEEAVADAARATRRDRAAAPDDDGNTARLRRLGLARDARVRREPAVECGVLLAPQRAHG